MAIFRVEEKCRNNEIFAGKNFRPMIKQFSASAIVHYVHKVELLGIIGRENICYENMKC